jgi:hypothetical protein
VGAPRGAVRLWELAPIVGRHPDRVLVAGVRGLAAAGERGAWTDPEKETELAEPGRTVTFSIYSK